jgi:hypothetical protein
MRCDGPIEGRGLQRLCAKCVKTWKWCDGCKTLRKRTAFQLPNGREVRYCYDPCILAKGREQRSTQENKDWSYRRHLKRKFGLNAEEADLWASIKQCSVCKVEEDRINMHVDHNHRTGRIRGVLCRRCNFAASVLDGDPTWLESLKKYLTRDVPRVAFPLHNG